MMEEREHAADPFLATYSAPSHAQDPFNPYTDAPHPYARPQVPYTDSQDSGSGYPPASPDASAPALLLGGGAPVMAEYAMSRSRRSGGKRKKGWIGLGVLAGVLAVAAAVVLPVYFLVVRKHPASSSSSASAGGGSAGGSGGGANTTTVGAVTTGGDGSVVTTDAGDTFVYSNPFGGYWVADPTDPFNDGAAPNAWTPPLNQSWDWAADRVYGVNLGGWFVLEPFITPALFQPYPSAPDEWTLSTLMAADGSLGATMEAHYDTFITEEDFAQIAGAGLNWVRLPIPFWAISTWPDVGTAPGTGTAVAEPFLAGVCWRYIIRALGWARKYGLRVNLDLHTVPGSQNGYNHSGKLGQVNFLNGIMGVANAQRTLDYIRIITEFVSQPEYVNLIPMFGIVNEALLSTIGRPQLTSFYLEAHDMIRGITGLGAGNGPFISIHDGFDGVPNWAGFLPGSDRIILDTHPYFAFDQQPNDAPIATGTDPATAGGTWPLQACNSWGPLINTSRSAFGVTVAGEFSNGYNDCGLYLNGVNGTHFYGGDCDLWQDSSTWNASIKAGVGKFALASMDAMQDWFFWTWKIGNATDGVVSSPLWSYQLGLQGGWMPTDPRTANGTCAALGANSAPFDGVFSAWQTGGAGAGTIAPSAIASFGTYPPQTISNVPAAALTLLPTYTATGGVSTLTYVTPTASVTGSGTVVSAAPTVSVGDGWVDAGDTAPGVTTVAGCTYPDAWSALGAPAPTALCTGS
ncbi:glycoside hydrolase family 5 protein [Mycena maculata]|uniref:glucan 1,3-beta-glucosidase n=1 Tax=Mycena maculata TaxID=230809 RepID=A0AAD7J7S0_9AGAR|nr:glycoside hydrolase family 5 protein [Mycena maculata]